MRDFKRSFHHILKISPLQTLDISTVGMDIAILHNRTF
jgi:hypothetical protein